MSTTSSAVGSRFSQQEVADSVRSTNGTDWNSLAHRPRFVSNGDGNGRSNDESLSSRTRLPVATLPQANGHVSRMHHHSCSTTSLCRTHRTKWSVSGLLSLLVLVSVSTAHDGAGPNVDFEANVAPVLISRCLECHQSESSAGNLDLSSESGWRRGGDSGEAIDWDAPSESYLIERIRDHEMPPPEKGVARPLPEEELNSLIAWIEAGLPWPDGRQLTLFEQTTKTRAGLDWWSLQPIQRPAVPAASDNPDLHPIDAFVQRNLQRHGMVPAPTANRQTLIRRLYVDLHGLPPTTEQIEAFESDPSPDAWEELIDSLLEQPQYGERWARHWLDLARFADTSGYERDQEKPFAWKYRDWVVRAFNEDLPYRDFVTHQLAGDEISDVTNDSRIATGFLRLGTWNDEPNEPKDYVYDRLEDLVHTTSTAFLGMTVKCARCHTHKFDPIEQRDYYRLAAAFWPGPIQPRDRAYLGGPTEEEFGEKDILGWTDVTTKPSPLHVLKNGERDQPLDAIVPASLSFLPELFAEFEHPAETSETTGRRRQLAEWITHPENPLTPRVIVNRIWQHHFGQGLVRTPNNFGFLADSPTHPELLDWLAAEFQESGGSFKHMHRVILTSQTWQQSAIHPNSESYELADAGNRHWWRSERRRLDAESLRDAMLASTGELDLRVGGPSFKPTISAEALEGLSRKQSAWQASTIDEQRRRSLYMYMKRGLLPPLMTTFDLCDPTQSCGQRTSTLVPTQALSLLNNEFVHRRSEALAQQVVESTDEVQRIKELWSAILGREPNENEIGLAKSHLRVQRARFSKPKKSPPVTPTKTDEISSSLVLWLEAENVQTSGGSQSVEEWTDQSGQGNDARQSESESRPAWEQKGINGRPAVRFSGASQYMRLRQNVLEKPGFTIVVVARDNGSSGHREIISNWNHNGNSTSSVFLGLTDERRVRFSDVFQPEAELVAPEEPFVLSAVDSSNQTYVRQNGRTLGQLNSGLTGRKYDLPWVIGQQGNIDGEYWNGEIAEIRVYGRALSVDELQVVEGELGQKYNVGIQQEETKALIDDPDVLALASLAHVLFNSNEFIYVD